MKLAMLTSVGLSMVAAFALAAQSATAPEKGGPTRSCCAKKSADPPMKCEKPAAAEGDAARHAGHDKMRCSLTGKVVDTCCCVEREGKTHCTLADKDVAECCCTPLDDENPASAKTS